jgi:hypothetical protein
VPANRLLPRFADEDQVIADLQVAVDAANRSDTAQVFEPAIRAHAAATSMYLWSIAGGAFHPEIQAIVAVIDALLLTGRAAGSLPHLPDAEQLAARALFTNAHLPMLLAERRHEMDQQLRERHAVALESQLAILAEPDTSHSTAMLAILRASVFEREGQLMVEDQRYATAVEAFELALADHLAVIVALAGAGVDDVATEQEVAAERTRRALAAA